MSALWNTISTGGGRHQQPTYVTKHVNVVAPFTSSDCAGHEAYKYKGGHQRAAYVFSHFGSCSLRQKAQLLTGITLLQRTQPQFPIAVMLSPSCWQNASFRALLRSETISPLCVPRLSNISCHGPLQRGDFFSEHWTKLNLFNLTGLRAAFYLDSDLVVRRSLDHVLRGLLNAPRLQEARTPQGCLGADAVSTYFNTGVWAIKPSSSSYDRFISWLRRGSSNCWDGDQSAAMGFWRLHGQGGRRDHEVMHLHVGYNMKADQGPVRCLHVRGLNESQLHVVHFSGREKPYNSQPNKDSLWRGSRLEFVDAFDSWARRLGVSTCTKGQMMSNEGCKRRL